MRGCFFVLLLICLWGTSSFAFEFATWNLRYVAEEDSVKGNGWNVRLPHIVEVVRFYDFDILNTQEVDKRQMGDLLENLPGYAALKLNQRNENAIFFKKDRFTALDSGEFYLSKTPEVRSKDWGSDRTRYCLWIKFASADQDTFYVFNTHFDHKSQEARKNSALLLNSKIPEIAGRYPIFLAGDFNMDQTSEPYKILNKFDAYKEASGKADYVYIPNGSFNHFYAKKFGKWQLDHVFVSPQIQVRRYGVLNVPYYNGEDWRHPSDHSPVYIKATLGRGR